MVSNKHAYLIMAFNEFELLGAQLRLLDHVRNTLFIHIDKKAKVDISHFKNIVKYSDIYFVDRMDVSWGGFTQVQCELNLIKSALSVGEFRYLHILSGTDLPIKTNEYILDFFDKNDGKEFISFDEITEQSKEFYDRFKFYYIFQDKFGKRYKFITRLQILLIRFEKLVKINRIKNNELDFRKGMNWVSITSELAEHIVDKEKEIQKIFSKGWCVDEVFLQTFAWNSPFKSKITGQSMRYIDWNRGSPYTFKNKDFDELFQSDMLFARKFSYQEKELIYRIEQKLLVDDKSNSI